MAVPNNYIDKIKKDGDSRMISPAADMVRVDNDNFEGTDLDEVLDEVAQAIGEAGEGGYAPPAGGIPKTDLATAVQESLNLADSSLQPSDRTQLQGAITQLQNALNTLIGSGNVQGAIDTFNEVTAFLAGISSSDTLAAKLAQIQQSIPDTSGLATKTELQQGLGTKQDTLTFDNTPTANSNNPVKSSGIKTYVDGKATITGITTSQDGTFTITQSDGNSFTVDLNHTHPQYLTEHQSLSGYAKFVLCQDETEYNAISNKDSSTLYLIPES